MFNRLKSVFRTPEPAGPPEEIKAFAPVDETIARDGVARDGEGWRIEFSGERSVQLFELDVSPGTENCMLVYRARMKAAALSGQAYPELWCRLPGRGNFFSKGLDKPLRGTSDWSEHEVSFHLRKGQQPDLLQFNAFADGPGTVWISNVRLLKIPLR